jgi:magnesium transporter
LIILGVTLLLNFGTSLSITVSLALLCVIIFAALFGTFVPLMLHRYKIDPALATGPFITTVNDIIGLMIYFAVGSLISGLILG